MHLKKFALIYVIVLCGGLLLLSFKDLIFIAGAESQLAKVAFHVPGPTETYHKLGGSYEEKTLRPAIQFKVGDDKLTHIPEYSCKDGCHEIGSNIFIFYKKDHPQDVLVSSFGGMWKGKIYFLIIMAVLLVTAFPYLYYNVNKPRGSGSNG